MFKRMMLGALTLVISTIFAMESDEHPAFSPGIVEFQCRKTELVTLARARIQETQWMKDLLCERSSAKLRDNFNILYHFTNIPLEDILLTHKEHLVAFAQDGFNSDINLFSQILDSTALPFTKEIDDLLLRYHKAVMQMKRDLSQETQIIPEIMGAITPSEYCKSIARDDLVYIETLIDQLRPFQFGKFYYYERMLSLVGESYQLQLTGVGVSKCIEELVIETESKLKILLNQKMIPPSAIDPLSKLFESKLTDVVSVITTWNWNTPQEKWGSFWDILASLVQTKQQICSEAYLNSFQDLTKPEKAKPKKKRKKRKQKKVTSVATLQTIENSEAGKSHPPADHIDTQSTQEKAANISPIGTAETSPLTSQENAADVFYGPSLPSRSERQKLTKKAKAEEAVRAKASNRQRRLSMSSPVPKSQKVAKLPWMNDLNDPAKTIKFEQIEQDLRSLCGSHYRNNFGSSRVKVYIENTPRGGPISCNFHPIHPPAAIGIEHWRKTLLDTLHDAGYFDEGE